MDNRHDRNARHRLEPKVGDFWHEMFVPIMVVLGVSDDAVTICDKVDRGRETWTWDFSGTRKMTRSEFAARPLYGGHMGDKCWCDVVPEAHRWARKAAQEALFGDTSETVHQ